MIEGLLLLILFTSTSCYSSREAVVVLSDKLTSCLSQRLEALVQTAGPHRDVWFLHSDLKAETLSLSERINVALQPTVSHLGENSKSFHGPRSHSSTLSFLLWFNGSKYSNAWYVESDAFYTGLWYNVFDEFPPELDLISQILKTDKNYFFFRDCKIDGIECKSIEDVKTIRWFVSRMSHRLANTILNELILGTSHGHHEAITYLILTKHNFSSVDIHTKVPGTMLPGGYGDYKINNHINMTLSHHDVQPNHLYHPIKCQADPSLGMKALMWINQSIPESDKIIQSTILLTTPYRNFL